MRAQRRISTHTPLAGRDGYLAQSRFTYYTFLLTRPSRGATLATQLQFQNRQDFYSHAPRGARQLFATYFDFDFGFLLTRPSRGATATFSM